MNIITTTDSRLISNRLLTILSDLPNVNLIAVTEGIEEAGNIISENEVEVLIAAFHNLQDIVFKKLKEIKNNNRALIIIVLTGNLEEQYLKQWRDAGADYIFDYVFHFSKLIDVLSERIYKDILESFKSNRLNKKIQSKVLENNQFIKKG